MRRDDPLHRYVPAFQAMFLVYLVGCMSGNDILSQEFFLIFALGSSTSALFAEKITPAVTKEKEAQKEISYKFSM